MKKPATGRSSAEQTVRDIRWVPRWMRFAPGCYTERGGVPTMRVAAEAQARGVSGEPEFDEGEEPEIEDGDEAEPVAGHDPEALRHAA